MKKNFKLIFILFLFFVFQPAFLSAAEVRVIDLNSEVDNINETIIEETDNNTDIITNEVIVEEVNEIQILNNTSTKLNDDTINNEFFDLEAAWKNSEKENIFLLFGKINENIYSNIIRKNLINYLKYGSIPPENMNQSEFDILRIKALKKLTNIDEVIDVIENINTYQENKDYYDLIIMEKNLNDYDISSLCNNIEITNGNNNSNILKTRIFCSFLNDNHDEAEFYNSLLLEDNNDEYFQALYNKLIGINNEIKDIQEYNYQEESFSLYSAMMRSFDLPFTKDFTKLGSPELLRAIAISPSSNIEIRIDAAQKAYKLNSLNAESVAAIYQSVDFSSKELNNPLSTIEGEYQSNHQLAMALLFQSSRIQILPISRLEALNNFWLYSKKIGQTKLAYELSKDLLKSIEPTNELIDFAIQTSKAYLHNNNIEESKKWLKLVETSAIYNEDKDLNKDYLQQIFLISLLDGKTKFDERLHKEIINHIKISEEDIENLEIYLTTLEYIGFDIPNSLWQLTSDKTYDDRSIPSIYMIKLLEESVSNNLMGDLILNISISINEKKWSEVHPQHILLIFKNLKSANKDKIIKDIAIEILEDIN